MSRIMFAADILLVLMLLFLAQELSAAEPDSAADAPMSIEQKRAWIEGNLDLVTRSERERTVLSERLSTMSATDIDRKFRAGQKQRELNERQDFRRENASRENAQQQNVPQQNVPQQAAGFQPVIVWLPSGTSFGASGVISPDGRYVRTSASPFFSSIGPVNTFTYQTGYPYPYRRYPNYGYGAYPVSGTTTVEHRNPGVVGWQPSGSHSMGNRLGVSPTRPRFLDATGPEQR